jgi:hypothetical protein
VLLMGNFISEKEYSKTAVWGAFAQEKSPE